jgi:hypothetical protein
MSDFPTIYAIKIPMTTLIEADFKVSEIAADVSLSSFEAN